ncbi:unnamed protein product [Closterium sp. NIES-64]|nr:unnamed protein product [Closterium sp. NIES-64]
MPCKERQAAQLAAADGGGAGLEAAWFGLDSRVRARQQGAVQGHTDLTLLQTLLQLPITFFPSSPPAISLALILPLHSFPPPRFGLDSRVQGHTDLTLLQTLQHVDHLKMERLVLLLLVGLQHLASRSADNDWSPVPRGAVLAPGAAEGASAAAGEAAGGAAGGGGGKEAELAVVPPISLSRARRSLSESVPTVGDWETLPRRIAAMEEEEKARAEEGASDSAAAEGLGGGETGRPRSAGLEAGAVDAAGSAEPPVWRQVRQASLTEVSLEPVPEVEVMEGEEGEGEGEEEGEGEKGEREEGEEEEEEVHKKEKDDLLAPLASKAGGGGGSRPSSSSGKLIPAVAAATAAAAGAAGTSASTAENAESPAAAARRALASGMGTSRKSLENALRMGGNAGKRPVDAAGDFGSPLDRGKLPGSAAGSGPPLAGEALLAAMTMSQGFGPAARGAASEEMMEAMREATYGRSRSHTFAMAARPEPNPRFFTKSLSRYSLLRRMEAEEAVGGGAAGSSSTGGGGSIFVAPQRFLPMTPATVDVDRIHDVKPDLDLTSVAAPRLGGRLVALVYACCAAAGRSGAGAGGSGAAAGRSGAGAGGSGAGAGGSGAAAGRSGAGAGESGAAAGIVACC